MKILVVRFSSIGDIVLTTPVLRGLKEQLPNVEIHYLTKKKFAVILENNPRIDQLHTMENHIDELIPTLKKEKFDLIVDLHNNLRTKTLKAKLKRPSKAFNKLNWKKWLLVKFKINKMPKMHIVERYFDTVASLGVKNDRLPCEYFIVENDEVDVQQALNVEAKKFVAIAIGAQFKTKKMPKELLVKIISQLNEPVVLLGGEMDADFANELIETLPDSTIKNACGGYNLNQSASIVKLCKRLITNDTGMMHIASCFDVQINSVWGNTVPDLGMYPYYPQNKEKFSIHEVKGLNCRPCSKIGFQECPKKHFDCMMKQDAGEITHP
ncbi:MAG: glycosyltransferase family 9 protein [Fluviicola sp.]|nr:glycosyltransferase family 9 protein [Fluviicola sp.]